MGRKKLNLKAAIPAAAIGIICAGVGAFAGCKTSKEVILEKGADVSCLVLRKKK